MRRAPLVLVLVLVAHAGGTPAVPGSSLGPRASRPHALTAMVDPLIGTGGHGHTYPGASVPFGMVQLSPDTRLEGWDGCSGYHYDDSRVFGFSHTHLSGTGIPDYCDVLMMPTTGEVRFHNGADGKPGYSSRFSHERERAAPGYYNVTLDDYRIGVELTATERVGLHRYTFPAGVPGQVIVDLEHRDLVLDASLRVVGDREIEGARRSRSWAADQQLYFVARFSRAFESHGVEGRKAFVRFGDAGGEVVVKVAISAVSVEGARRNLDAEMPAWDFDDARRRAGVAWESELSRIRVEGGTERQQRIFYTALYHAMLAPNLFMDVDGQYRGRDGRVHRAEGFRVHTVFSLWDTFRALHPLLTITHRERTADFVRTFLAQYREGGRLPVWELAANETDCMIGYHAVSVIADAILKGIGGFDVELAFEAMKHSAEEDRRGLDGYKRDGFVAADREPESVSKTLEYAYDDWCIAMVAKRLGRKDDYARYLARAQSYKNLFDPSSGFMRARMEGAWFSPFDPAEVNFNYTEANAWQYAFFVPHDMDGLIALHGGRAAFARKLDGLFSAESRITGTQQADVTGLVGQYAHGNEPSHHIAYLYAFAGQPWKTQALVRRLLDEMYSDRPDGLIGNEDCGQMSAWFVMSAVGFYPVTPGSGEYILGSPLFDLATIRLENGKTFVVRANGQSPTAVYVQSATLDGRPLRRAALDHAAVAAGGELVFEMGERPNPAWGDAPRTAVDQHELLPMPFVASGAQRFKGRTAVALGVAADAEIRYTLDGSEPTAASARYSKPLAIDRETTIRARAFRAGVGPSSVLVARFSEMPEHRTISLDVRYAPQYSGSGDAALVDGLRAGPNFRLGRWQGYQGKDLEAIVDLGSVRELRGVGMGFLQDAASWILMPKDVAFAISEDGAAWREVGTARSDVSDRETGVVTRDLGVAFGPARARFVRVRVRHYGALPSWHLGAGNPAWFFADEITIEQYRER